MVLMHQAGTARIRGGGTQWFGGDKQGFWKPIQEPTMEKRQQLECACGLGGGLKKGCGGKKKGGQLLTILEKREEGN